VYSVQVHGQNIQWSDKSGLPEYIDQVFQKSGWTEGFWEVRMGSKASEMLSFYGVIRAFPPQYYHTDICPESAAPQIGK
jgi:hypothetical protein